MNSLKSFKNLSQAKADRLNEIYQNQQFQTFERKPSKIKLSPLIPSSSHKDYKTHKQYDILSRPAENPKLMENSEYIKLKLEEYN